MSHHYIRLSSRIARQELDEEHRSFLEEKLFDAIVASGVIVALADGRADEVERSVCADFVDRSHRLSTFTSADAIHAFDSYARQLEKDSDVPEAWQATLRRVSNRASGDDVLCVARKVAFADGSLHSAEEQALDLIRLGVAPSHKTPSALFPT